jgi:hypothetical protein
MAYTITRNGTNIVIQVQMMRIITATDPPTAEIDALAYRTEPTVQVSSIPVLSFDFAGMVVVMGDAKRRADAFAAAGMDDGLALFGGIRDAVYAAIDASGLI